MTAALTDEEFTSRLRAIDAQLAATDGDQPSPEAFERACLAIDEITADAASLADERRRAELRATVTWLYREARSWEVALPADWSTRQAARLEIPTAAEFNAREEAFRARLDVARVDHGRAAGDPPPGQADFDRAFRAIDELLDDPAVQADHHRLADVEAAAEYLHRRAAVQGITPPP